MYNVNVALIEQPSYERMSLHAAISRAITSAGFDLSSVSRKKVLLKPNMLGAYPPWMGVTTNPIFVEETAKIFLEAGAIVSIGDSPNGVHDLDKVWEITGIAGVCKKLGIEEAHFEESGSVEVNGVRIARAVCKADFVINLPKFKTHSLTILTLAVKNLFGCVNGMQKTRFHSELRTTKSFAEALVRIAEASKPSFTLVDGIMAMDGEGPSAGNPINLKVIVAAKNIHHVDSICCRLAGLEPMKLDTLDAAFRMGLYDPSLPVSIVGDPIEKLMPNKFSLPSTYSKGIRDWKVTRFVLDRIWSNMSSQPVIDDKKCKKCGYCIKACPVNAISNTKNMVKINHEDCIQCFCCHETCPHKSIHLKTSLVMKIARTLSETMIKRMRQVR